MVNAPSRRDAVRRRIATLETHRCLNIFAAQPNQLRSAEEGVIPPFARPESPEAVRRPATSPRVRSYVEKQLWLLTAIIFLSLVIYTLISRYVVTSVHVQGRSMTPTLQDGERYLLSRWRYRFAEPQRGDIVVLKDPGHTDFAVKRIIAGPLDTIHFKNGRVFVNGQRLAEPYLSAGMPTYTADCHEQYDVPGKDRYFVLGDNRLVSEDSRYYGSVRREHILGAILP